MTYLLITDHNPRNKMDIEIMGVDDVESDEEEGQGKINMSWFLAVIKGRQLRDP